MSKASIETFLLQVNTSKIKIDKVRIYRYIKRNPLCTKDDLIRELKIPHQTVTARLSMLLDMGVIEIKGSSKKITGAVSMFIIQTDPKLISINSASRRTEKYKKWLKAGEQFNDLISA